MFQLRQVTTEEVSEIITMMPSNKAPGNDTVHLRVLKDCLSSVVQPITSIINSSFLKGIFPSQWKISEITPIPKNDDYEEAQPRPRPFIFIIFLIFGFFIIKFEATLLLCCERSK